jgi:antitoxin component of MazEF toxin-antitoxin module
MSDDEEKYHRLGERKLIQKGGSVAVTLPHEVVKILKLENEVAFIREGNRVFLVNPVVFQRSTELVMKGEELLGHPLTKKELEKLIEALKKKEG